MLDAVKPKAIIHPSNTVKSNTEKDNVIIFLLEIYTIRDAWKLYEVKAIRNSWKTLWDDWTYYIYNSTIMSYELKQMWTDFNNEWCYKCFVKYILTHRIIKYLKML